MCKEYNEKSIIKIKVIEDDRSREERIGKKRLVSRGVLTLLVRCPCFNLVGL